MSFFRKNEEKEIKDIYSNSKRKISRSRKKLLAIVGIVLSLCTGVSGVGLVYVYNRLDSLNYKNLEPNQGKADVNLDGDYDGTLLKDPQVLNVALFGVDKRSDAEGNSRSDSTMILTIDNRRKKLKITSLLRDIYLPIKGHLDNRLNAAFSFGRETLAIDTIQRNFGVKIDRFVNVDFESFREIINIIGGIDLTLSKDELKHINYLLKDIEGGQFLMPETAGTYHVNGSQALHYARSRKVSLPDGTPGEYARTYRQRLVITKIVEKMKSCNLGQIMNIMEKIGPYIETNLKKSELIKLGSSSTTYVNYPIEEFRLPTDNNMKEGEYRRGMWVFIIPDWQLLRYDLAKFIFEDSIIIT